MNKSGVCAMCGAPGLRQILDFGKVGLAGGFIKKDQFSCEAMYHLSLSFCPSCFGVQVPEHVDSDILFQDYFYFSSSIQTLQNHFSQYAKEVSSRFLNPGAGTVIEFGCNDGVLLRPLADQGIKKVIGVDPAANVVGKINDSRITIYNDYFNLETVKKITAQHGRADLVLANNVFAHISDINGITEAVRQAMHDEGVFIFEVHYLGKMIEKLQYDMVYHEHLYYYSLLSLDILLGRHEMVVFDVKPVSTHAGSMRFYVCKKGSKKALLTSPRVEALRKEEKTKALHLFAGYNDFAKKIEKHKNDLIKLLNRLKKNGKKIVGYGASGRANTMIQYCGINNTILDYIIDDAPAKIGFYTPVSHLKICPRSILEVDDPDYILIFAWSFSDEIRKRCDTFLNRGGKFIIPLPIVAIMGCEQSKGTIQELGV